MNIYKQSLLTTVIVSAISVNTSVSAENTTDSDQLFEWAEINFSQFFSPTEQTSGTIEQYYYRYYPGTNTVLATSGNNVHYYSPDVNPDIQTIGLINDFVQIDSDNYTYPVVDTGQNACYDNDGATITCPGSGDEFFGQDAQFSGYQSNYTDNSNGTISDNVTQLLWQQSPASNGLSWQEAVDYCSSLELGGSNSWRIPTTKELFSISNFSQGWPYLDSNYFNLAESGSQVSKDEQYWADYYVGSTVEGGSNAAFGVNHATGHIKAYAANISGRFGNYVRCVQGDTYGVNEFVENGDGTVTDKATGLMWEQSDSGSGMNWEDALIYAEKATTGDYDDWRLPNIKELQSIVDYNRSPSASNSENMGPAIDINYFNISQLESDTTKTNPDYGYFWSSTSAYFGGDSTEYYYAWYVAFGTAVDGNGDDFHGAGGVRFDTKYEGGALGEGGERYYNYVRLVRVAK